MKTTSKADVRTDKDIEEDVDMGTVAAELSGLRHQILLWSILVRAI